MVVQHNLTAQNASNNLETSRTARAKSTEKLSSGYSINRAADDAAGLSISEKMRKQIRGLQQASSNAEDGISAMQTAEGALTEVHDMLQRMNELCVQAASGTNSASDRISIQDEISQLNTEIDRVAETTKFNETYLLNGIKSSSHTINLNARDAGITGITFTVSAAKNSELQGDDVLQFDVTMAMLGISLGDQFIIGGKEYTIGQQVDSADKVEKDYQFTSASNAYVSDTDDTLIDFTKAKQLIASEIMKASSIGAESYSSKASIYIDTTEGSTENKLDVLKDANLGETGKKSTFYIKLATTTVNDDLDFHLHVGLEADLANKILVTVGAMNSKYLGIDGLSVVDADGQEGGMAATYAIDAVSDAIDKVSKQRSALGAIQNRLEHTTGNLDNVVENTTSAESRIRDTDMAEEMIDFSKARILNWSSLAMLAQANSSPKSVMYLLK